MPFKLHIFENEMRKVEDFVLCYPNIETGGDLFGLWRAYGDPVVQLIIGPGKNCRRTTVSFHQDTSYLARVGTYVNSEFMLCHIGSWHSHHHLSLTQPSAGDRSTVCNNFPEGLKRYIMIIANITRGTSGRENVVLHPYMFTKGGHLCEPGSVMSIPGRSPFREHGLVVACVGNGIEHSLATDAYSSRAPLEYQNRPSTQSKYISTSKNSHLPHLTHQNFSAKTDAFDPKPMDVDKPEDDRGGLRSERRVPENNNGVSQWYETEEGRTKLKEIVKEITATMSKNIVFDRDKNSKNLTMKFAHGGKNWSINFPESFDNKPAIIVNPLNKDDLFSKNVILDIRRACKCRECQIHENNVHQRAPSRKDHRPSSPKRSYSPTHKKQDPPHPPFSPSKPQPPSLSRHDRPSHSKQVRYSPYDKSQNSQMETRRSQPWYDTGEGKLLVESIKTNIETHLKNSTKVKTKEVMKFKGRTKQLLFYHNYQNWIIEFVSLGDIELKREEHGKAMCVAKLSSPDDVVGQVMKHCFCSGCQRTTRTPSARQGRLGSALVHGRPKSRHNIPRRSSPRITSTASPRFFETFDGEKKFRRICTQISATLLNGRDVGMERDVISRDIEVKFPHNGKQCSIVFPFTFPRDLPDVCIRNRSSKEVIRQCPNVVHTIRERCM